MCELDGFMYVTGGAESWNCLNTVERYNPENNTWTLVAPMNVARRGAGVAVHAGEPMTTNEQQVVVGMADSLLCVWFKIIMFCEKLTLSRKRCSFCAEHNFSRLC